MPVTLPAHPAAVLPLLRFHRWLPPVALVVGACVPDLHYVLTIGRVDSHTPLGLLTFCLPVGLVSLLWLEQLVLPVLRRTLPSVWGLQPARFLHSSGLPRGLRGWALAALALLVGSVTHLLWDGFTHVRMWPASELYPLLRVPVGSRHLRFASVLQYASSILGSLIVLGAMARAYRRLPEAPAGSWGGFLPVLLPTLMGGAWMLGLRLTHDHSVGSLYGKLWLLFWPTVTGALAAFTLACAWLRARLEP